MSNNKKTSTSIGREAVIGSEQNENSEITLDALKNLLTKQMGHRNSEVAALALRIDQDSSGMISTKEFAQWCATNVNPFTGPLDVLFDLVNPNVYWWFLQDMWLKFVVNVMYSAGYSGMFGGLLGEFD